MPGTVSEGQKGVGGWGEAGYHLYLPPAPLPPLTMEKTWEILTTPCLLEARKMCNPYISHRSRSFEAKWKENVESQCWPFHLPHPFSSAVLLSAFNGTRIHVFLLQNRTIFCPGSQSSKHNKQLWHSKLLLSLPTGKIQVALHTHNPGSQRKQAWMLSAGPANLIIASCVFKHDCKDI